MRQLIAFLTIVLAALSISAPANAQLFGPKNFIYEKGGYAIDGHDTVAYFDLDATALNDDGLPIPRAVDGDPQYSAEYQNATWLFSSQENLDRFNEDPARYTPQYNGYCAYAVANGNLAKTNANAWRIVDGKLFLNFNNSIQRKWFRDIPGNIERADVGWEGLTSKLKPLYG